MNCSALGGVLSLNCSALGGILYLNCIPRLSCSLKLYPSREALRFCYCKLALLDIFGGILYLMKVWFWVVSGLGDHVSHSLPPEPRFCGSGVVAFKQQEPRWESNHCIVSAITEHHRLMTNNSNSNPKRLNRQGSLHFISYSIRV